MQGRLLLDGRYQATDHDGDQHVLEINGTTGTGLRPRLMAVRNQQVQVDTSNQRPIVGVMLKAIAKMAISWLWDELDDDPETLTFTWKQ